MCPDACLWESALFLPIPLYLFPCMLNFQIVKKKYISYNHRLCYGQSVIITCHLLFKNKVLLVFLICNSSRNVASCLIKRCRKNGSYFPSYIFYLYALE